MSEYIEPANPHPRLLQLAPNGQRKLDFLAYLNKGVVVTSDHWLAGRPDVITKRPLPEAFTQPYIEPQGSIMHTQGGGSKATNEQAWGFAARPDIVNDAHFYGPDMVSGAMIQAMPFNKRADSNYLGNLFSVRWPDGSIHIVGYISWETQDLGDATLKTTPWTIPQLSTIMLSMVALHFTYRIPCGQMATATSRGIGHHSLFPAWSSGGHDCPRAARIHQMDIIRQGVGDTLAHLYDFVGESCPA